MNPVVQPLVTITASPSGTAHPTISMNNQNPVVIPRYQSVWSSPIYYRHYSYLPVQPHNFSTNVDNTNEGIVERSEDKVDTNDIKRLVHLIATIGLTLGLFILCLIIGILSLIYSLRPSVPTGTIFPYSGSAADLVRNDDQWLFCDGSTVSRTKYSALFLVIGTTYGAGNGMDTFNLPDLRSRFLWGSSGMNETALVSGGNATHTLSVAQIPSHSHDSGTLGTVANGLHSHTYTQTTHNHGGSTGLGTHPNSGVYVAAGFNYYVYNSIANVAHSINGDSANIIIQNAGQHSHTIIGATDTEGQGEAFSKMPPYQTVHYIIRV